MKTAEDLESASVRQLNVQKQNNGCSIYLLLDQESGTLHFDVP